MPSSEFYIEDALYIADLNRIELRFNKSISSVNPDLFALVSRRYEAGNVQNIAEYDVSSNSWLVNTYEVDYEGGSLQNDVMIPISTVEIDQFDDTKLTISFNSKDSNGNNLYEIPDGYLELVTASSESILSISVDGDTWNAEYIDMVAVSNVISIPRLDYFQNFGIVADPPAEMPIDAYHMISVYDLDQPLENEYLAPYLNQYSSWITPSDRFPYVDFLGKVVTNNNPNLIDTDHLLITQSYIFDIDEYNSARVNSQDGTLLELFTPELPTLQVTDSNFSTFEYHYLSFDSDVGNSISESFAYGFADLVSAELGIKEEIYWNYSGGSTITVRLPKKYEAIPGFFGELTLESSGEAKSGDKNISITPFSFKIDLINTPEVVLPTDRSLDNPLVIDFGISQELDTIGRTNLKAFKDGIELTLDETNSLFKLIDEYDIGLFATSEVLPLSDFVNQNNLWDLALIGNLDLTSSYRVEYGVEHGNITGIIHKLAIDITPQENLYGNINYLDISTQIQNNLDAEFISLSRPSDMKLAQEFSQLNKDSGTHYQGSNDSDTLTQNNHLDLFEAMNGDDFIILQSDIFWAKNYQAFNTETGVRIELAEKYLRYGTLSDGGDGTDTIVLSNSSDAFFLHDSWTEMHTSLHDQRVTDTDGRSTIERISGIETILSGAGDDIIDLTSENFSLAGKNMTVFAGDGNDIIWGAGSDDTLDGGQGQDVLFGGGGDDILTGGNGADIFEFVSTSEARTKIITDFSVEDTLKFYLGESDSQISQANYQNGTLTWQNLSINLDSALAWEDLSIVYV